MAKKSASKKKTYVYVFGETKKGPEEIFTLGNKGAQLAEMTRLDLPVPPGFTISTQACNEFYALGKKWPAGLNASHHGCRYW